jgi:hypothetical protein
MRKALIILLLATASTVYGQITPGKYIDNEGLIWEFFADGSCTIENRSWADPITWFYTDLWGEDEDVKQGRPYGMIILGMAGATHHEDYKVYIHPYIDGALIVVWSVHSVVFNLRGKELWDYSSWLRRVE